MLQIGELSKQTGVSTKTIRYYEEIGVLPPPRRAENGYRVYDEDDVERLRFIRRARALDFTLDDIAEILAFRDRDEPPCDYVIALMKTRIEEIEARIQDLERVRDELLTLYQEGQRLPRDVRMRACVCHLIQAGIQKTTE